MVTSVTKSKIVETTWKNFYDRLKANVTSVSITGPTTVTIQTYASAYNEKMFETKSNFPILIVNMPELTDVANTFRDAISEGRIDIEISATQAEAADKFIDAINTSIQGYIDTFATYGITELYCDGVSSTQNIYGKINVHVRTATWRFEVEFTR